MHVVTYGAEVLVFDESSLTTHLLDVYSAEVLLSLETEQSEDEIGRMLQEQLDLPSETVSPERISLILRHLQAADLIESRN